MVVVISQPYSQQLGGHAPWLEVVGTLTTLYEYPLVGVLGSTLVTAKYGA